MLNLFNTNAYLEIYEVDEMGEPIEAPALMKKTYPVMFNPAAYSVTHHNKVEAKYSVLLPGSNQPQALHLYSRPQLQKFSTVLIFDTYEIYSKSAHDGFATGAAALLPTVIGNLLSKPPQPDVRKKIVDLVEMMAATNPDAANQRLRFVWNSFTFEGVVASAAIQFTMFFPDGTPARANVQLEMVGQETNGDMYGSDLLHASSGGKLSPLMKTALALAATALSIASAGPRIAKYAKHQHTKSERKKAAPSVAPAPIADIFEVLLSSLPDLPRGEARIPSAIDKEPGALGTASSRTTPVDDPSLITDDDTSVDSDEMVAVAPQSDGNAPPPSTESAQPTAPSVDLTHLADKGQSELENRVEELEQDNAEKVRAGEALLAQQETQPDLEAEREHIRNEKMQPILEKEAALTKQMELESEEASTAQTAEEGAEAASPTSESPSVAEGAPIDTLRTDVSTEDDAPRTSDDSSPLPADKTPRTLDKKRTELENEKDAVDELLAPGSDVPTDDPAILSLREEEKNQATSAAALAQTKEDLNKNAQEINEVNAILSGLGSTVRGESPAPLGGRILPKMQSETERGSGSRSDAEESGLAAAEAQSENTAASTATSGSGSDNPSNTAAGGSSNASTDDGAAEAHGSLDGESSGSDGADGDRVGNDPYDLGP